jgi:hypothetical protein
MDLIKPQKTAKQPLAHSKIISKFEPTKSNTIIKNQSLILQLSAERSLNLFTIPEEKYLRFTKGSR